MKSIALLILQILTCAAFAGEEPPATPAQKDARKLLQEGLFEEEANRDLDKAAAAYEGVIKQYNEQRNIAATAIFRMAEIRTKQGKKEEATKLFQQLLKEFPDQEPLLKVARERLAVDNPEIHREAASKAVEEWLKLVDAKEYGKSWETAAPYFKGKITQDGWVKMVAGVRQSFGELKKRGFVAANYHTIVPGAPKGEYFVMQFQSIFDDKEFTETITPMKTPEGDWRVSGYIMTPLTANTPGNTTKVEPPAKVDLPAMTKEESEELVRIQEMVKNSPDLINAGGEGGELPLVKAASKGWINAATFLLDNGAKINATDGENTGEATPLIKAAEKGHKRMVELLLARGADINLMPLTCDTALYTACFNNRKEIVQLLLEKGADPNLMCVQGNLTALFIAIQKNFVEIAALLLDHKADPNLAVKTGNKPLGFAAFFGNEEMIKLLLKRGAEINSAHKGMTPLHVALEQGKDAAARLLIDNGAKIDTASDDGNTPLHAAAGRVSALIPLLLEKGASVSAVNSAGETPLHQLAGAFTKEEEIRRSLERELVPLEQEKIAGLRVAMETLLGKGAKINATNNAGETPFRSAVSSKTIPQEILLWMAEQGADLETPSKNDKRSPLEMMGEEQRFVFQKRFIIPKLAKEPAIHVTTPGKSAYLAIKRTVPFEAPPLLRDVLRESLNPKATKSAKYPFINKSLTIKIFRIQNGELIEAHSLPFSSDEDININQMRNYPPLFWGDVIHYGNEGDPRTPSHVHMNRIQSDAPEVPRKITIQLGDRTGELILSPSLPPQFSSPDSPSTSPQHDFRSKLISTRSTPSNKQEPPDWEFSQLLAYISTGEPRADLKAVKVQRQTNGKMEEWTVDAHTGKPDEAEAGFDGHPTEVKYLPARLADGDKVIIPLLKDNAPEVISKRRQFIFHTAPGRVFTQRVLERQKGERPPRSLAELIMKAYSLPMATRSPDFSKVTIHRLKDNGEEEHIPVNLEQSITDSVNLTYADSLDVPLQWGDIVEIQQIENAKPLGEPEKLDKRTMNFLRKAVSFKIPLKVNGQNTVHPISTERGVSLTDTISDIHMHSDRKFEDEGILKITILHEGQPPRVLAGKQIEEENPLLERGDSLEVQTR